ncbi:MAG: serine/threonine-protein kinase, partial [Bacteroidetes bacterium]|nr:serine/threonine-protein kinase [Bacteroidota bacterium]
MVGKNLSHYKILEELGRGGMGIVYKAVDTKLDRTVAIKVLPSAALASEDDRTRFYREAKAAAQLHHPNIASVFEIDEAVPSDAPDGTEPSPFIAMEFIDGETLYEYIQKGPLKLTDAVNIASQVAEALKAAHAKEIVHRDIKSSNVMLTSDGTAKVLDFGLAKTDQSTMLTRLGSTLGTVAYMSPEQARGQDVDGRSDLYSLGTMLYEMVSGRKPFAGDYEQAIVYGILNEKPEPLTAVRTGVPMGLEWIVDKLLAKEPDYRYQTAADLLADLKTVDLSGSGHSRRSMVAATGSLAASETGPEAGVGKRTGLPGWGWGAIAGAILIGAVAGWFLKPAAETITEPSVRFEIELPPEEVLRRRSNRAVAIAPDGSMIAYRTAAGVLVRHTSDIERSNHLEGLSNPSELFFSPDSKWLGYQIRRENVLMRVSVSGGSEIPITDLPGPLSGAYWGEDGYVYLGFSELGMGRVPFSGGVVEMLATPSDSTSAFRYHGPVVLPDKRSVIYSLRRQEDSWDDAEIRLLDIVSGEDRRLHSGGSDARYLNSGHLIYVRRNSLYAIPFDAKRGQIVGTQTPVMDEVEFTSGGN